MSRIFINPSEVELQEESVISIKRVSKWIDESKDIDIKVSS